MTASDDKSAVLGVAPFGWHHNKEAHASAWRSALLLYIFLFPASSVRGSLSHVLYILDNHTFHNYYFFSAPLPALVPVSADQPAVAATPRSTRPLVLPLRTPRVTRNTIDQLPPVT